MREARGGGCERGCLIAFGAVMVLGLAVAFFGLRLIKAPESQQAESQAGGDLQARQVEIAQAVAGGLVSLRVRGMSTIDRIEVGASLEGEEPITLVIPAGTMFLPGDPSTQSMVSIRSTGLYLGKPHEMVVTKLDAACANMDFVVPGRSIEFSVSPQPASGDLAKLISTPGFQQTSVRTRQWAVWTITDNPTRSGYVSLGSLGISSSPTPEVLDRVKALFEEAGIDTSKYRALR